MPENAERRDIRRDARHSRHSGVHARTRTASDFPTRRRLLPHSANDQKMVRGKEHQAFGGVAGELPRPFAHRTDLGDRQDLHHPTIWDENPLRNDQLEDAVFDAYRSIEPRTIAILTRSVKFRVQLCIAREGKFVGDKLDECCRRAEIELASLTNIEIIPIEHEDMMGRTEKAMEKTRRDNNCHRFRNTFESRFMLKAVRKQIHQL